MLVNTENLAALHTMLSAAFTAGLAKADVSFADVAMTVPSNNKANSYAWLGAMGSMREWVGDRIIDQMAGETYIVQNKSWEKTISVDREDIEDDSYGIYAPLAEDLGFAGMSHRSKLVWQLLADGENQDSYDGVPFFSASHPKDGGTQSNLISGGEPAWYLMDTTRPVRPLMFQLRKDLELVALTDPTSANAFFSKKFIWGVDARYNAGFGLWQTCVKSKAALNETNLASARAAMRALTDSKGEPLALAPTTLVVGPSLETAAEKLVLNLVLANGESNVSRGRYRLIVSPYLP